MDHEDDIYLIMDAFYNKGLKLMRKEKWKQRAREHRLAQLEEGNEADDELEDDDDEVALLKGRLKCEQLKRALFEYLDQQILLCPGS